MKIFRALLRLQDDAQRKAKNLPPRSQSEIDAKATAWWRESNTTNAKMRRLGVGK
jgi:hypothetical protein